MDIVPTTPETGLTGYYLTPLIGAYRNTMGGEFISEVLSAKSEEFSDLEPRGESDQYLEPWENADLERLCLEIKEGENTEAQEPEIENNPISSVNRRKMSNEKE